MQEIKNNPQVYTTQEGMQEIKITLRYTLPKRVCKRSKVILRYTLPKRARKIEFTLIYIRRPLFVWTLSFDRKLRRPPLTYIIIFNFFPNVYWLLLTDILAISHDFCSGGISRLKCTVESDLIYRINNWIIFRDPTNPSTGIFPVQLAWHRDQLKI